MYTVRTPKIVLQKQDCRGNLCLYCKEPHKTGDKKICGEYTIEATIQNKMRLDKCDVYKAKETLGYMARKAYVAATREKKTREAQEEKQIHK